MCLTRLERCGFIAYYAFLGKAVSFSRSGLPIDKNRYYPDVDAAHRSRPTAEHCRARSTYEANPLLLNTDVAMPKSKRDLADLLRTVMIIEAVSARRPSMSADNIEKAIGNVKQAKDTGTRRFSSRRVAKGRRGDHGLDPKTLAKVLSLEPEAWPKCSSIIWQLVRSGQFDLPHPDVYYDELSNPVYNLLHLQALVFGPWPLGTIENPVTLVQLRCLVVLGTLDAVTALWKLLIEAVEAGNDKILLIATYIPPALAMFYRRPEGKRTAILLFARMRQLILDRVRFDGVELSLSRYDLAAVADQAPSWELPKFGMLRHSALRDQASVRWLGSSAEALGEPLRSGLPGDFRLPDPPDEVLDWFERALPRVRKVRRRPTTWAKWTGRVPWPIDVINQPHPSKASWGEYAIAQFKKELGDYFFADAS